MAYLQLNYHVNEVRFGETIKPIEKEDWLIGNVTNRFGNEAFIIKTPNSNLLPKSFVFVNNGVHVGIQFETSGMFNLGAYGYQEKFVNVKHIAIVRQPNNVWLWAYLIDENGINIATFCGYDDLDGLAHLVSDMKQEFGE
ncbi:MAG: hypothetical protein ACI3ZX_00420 [Candidatus Aphodosoma sp.]